MGEARCPWIGSGYKKLNGPEARLLCLHWAGGNARVFDAWSEHAQRLLCKVEMVPIELPGRMERGAEPAVEDMCELAEALVSALSRDAEWLFSTPVAVFGHSFGAVLGYEVAARLGERCCALYVSASRSPSVALLDKPVTSLNDRAIVSYLRSKGSSIPADMEDDVLEMVLAPLRSDYACLETYRFSKRLLACPVRVFGAESDDAIPLSSLEAWEATCANDRDFRLEHVFEAPASHFYITDEANAIEVVMAICHDILDGHPAVDEMPDAESEQPMKAMAPVISRCFRDVLRMNALPEADANFFDLGGSSLDTMALSTMIRSEAGVFVTQDTIFLNPTVGALASLVEFKLVSSSKNKKSKSGEPPELVKMHVVDDQRWFPISYGQAQMVACHAIAPNMYNMPTIIQIKGEFDRAMLRQAMKAVVESQDMLRTVVRELDPSKLEFSKDVSGGAVLASGSASPPVGPGRRPSLAQKSVSRARLRALTSVRQLSMGFITTELEKDLAFDETSDDDDDDANWHDEGGATPEATAYFQRVLPKECAEQCFELLEFDVATFDAARAIIERESVRAFDLGFPPVLRAVLVAPVDEPRTSYVAPRALFFLPAQCERLF